MLGEVIQTIGNYLGAKKQSEAIRDTNAENVAMQREFAQNGVRWRVEDAKAAGIHPLAAMGAQLNSPTVAIQPDTARGQFLSDMGQNIGRAISAKATQEEREQAFQDRQFQNAFNMMKLENMELENDLLRSQIPVNGHALPPPMPSLEVNAEVPPEVKPRVKVQAVPLSATDPRNPAKEAWQVPDYTFARTKTGLAIVPSNDVKQRIEDNPLPQFMWSIRNGLVPNFDSSGHRPDPKIYDPGKGRKWEWSIAGQEYRSVPIGSDWGLDRYHKQQKDFRDAREKAKSGATGKW